MVLARVLFSRKLLVAGADDCVTSSWVKLETSLSKRSRGDSSVCDQIGVTS